MSDALQVRIRERKEAHEHLMQKLVDRATADLAVRKAQLKMSQAECALQTQIILDRLDEKDTVPV
jgi:hypothetical protein